jgi:peptide/nickel transport system ATP-binding protein
VTAAALSVEHLTVTYRTPAGAVTAVDDVTFSVAAGEAVGLVGPSGAGKSTIARAAVRLAPVSAGTVRLDGRDLTFGGRRSRRELLGRVRLVFQDPYAALPPTLRVADVVAEPLVIAGRGRRPGDLAELVAEALEAVALTPVDRFAHRFPHQLSGGERQRVAFARAIIGGPSLVVADEPTGMLDVSLRTEIVDLMARLRADRGVAVVHITHDLALAQRSCARLVVLAGGRLVEAGPTDRILHAPQHPATAALVAAARR